MRRMTTMAGAPLDTQHIISQPPSTPTLKLFHDHRRVRISALVRPPNTWRYNASYEERAQAYKNVKSMIHASASSYSGGIEKEANNSYFVEKNLTTDIHLAPEFGNMHAVKYYPRAPPNSPRECKIPKSGRNQEDQEELFHPVTPTGDDTTISYNPYNSSSIPTSPSESEHEQEHIPKIPIMPVMPPMYKSKCNIDPRLKFVWTPTPSQIVVQHNLQLGGQMISQFDKYSHGHGHGHGHNYAKFVHKN